MSVKLLRVLWAVEALFLALLNPRAARQEGPVKKWLILGYAAIGDMIFLLPALEVLRKKYPHAHIALYFKETSICSELLPATGLIDEIIAPKQDCETASSAERAQTTKIIKQGGYDAVLLSFSAPAHFFQKAIARIPLRAGHCLTFDPPPHVRGAAALFWKIKRAIVTGELSRRLLLTHKVWVRPNREHAVIRNMRLCEKLGLTAVLLPPPPRIPISASAEKKIAALLGPRTRPKRVGIHLGLEHNAYFKIWSCGRMGQLCRLLEKGGQAECFFLGGPEEIEGLARARKEAGREVPSLIGRCSLIESFAAIKQCDLLISNDTGMAKAGMALGTPTATIWGPSGPAELGIIWEPEKHLEISTGIACNPCTLGGMPYASRAIDYTNCGHHDCLGQLSAETVFKALCRKYPWIV